MHSGKKSDMTTSCKRYGMTDWQTVISKLNDDDDDDNRMLVHSLSVCQSENDIVTSYCHNTKQPIFNCKNTVIFK